MAMNRQSVDTEGESRVRPVRAALRADGQITIPKEIREAAGIEEHDLFELEVTPEGILLRRVGRIDPDQAWFWTPKWQEGEREADEDLAAGRFTRYNSDEEFLASLRERRDRNANAR